MTAEHIALVIDDPGLNIDEFAVTCMVDRTWIVEHVGAGVLLNQADSDPMMWNFTSRDVIRARRLSSLEKTFDANPELAGLVADLIDEVERLRTRLKRTGF